MVVSKKQNAKIVFLCLEILSTALCCSRTVSEVLLLAAQRHNSGDRSLVKRKGSFI